MDALEERKTGIEERLKKHRTTLAVGMFIIFMVLSIWILISIRTNIDLLKADPCQVCRDAGFFCSRVLG
jgi:hypothetical protein